MRETEYLQCLHFGCLMKGHIENQTIPIVLPCTTEDKERLKTSSTIALCYKEKLIALLKQPEFVCQGSGGGSNFFGGLAADCFEIADEVRLVVVAYHLGN